MTLDELIRALMEVRGYLGRGDQKVTLGINGQLLRDAEVLRIEVFHNIRRGDPPPEEPLMSLFDPDEFCPGDR